MEGRKLISEVPASIQSAVKFHVYEIARGILQINKNLRKEALYKLPEAVQPLVEAEVRRLFDVYAAKRK